MTDQLDASAGAIGLKPRFSALRPDRPQTRVEDIANSASHGLGLLLAVIGTPFLMISGIKSESVAYLISVTVFSLSMALLYALSSIYHGLLPGPKKRTFRVIEHAAIYVLIAGTYTPFAMGVLKDGVGWPLLIVIWILAALGVWFKFRKGVTQSLLSTLLYLGMGWLIVLVFKPLSMALASEGLNWLVAGGLFYTVGVIFYSMDTRFLFGHLVWHLFVLAGTTCHYISVLFYAAGV